MSDHEPELLATRERHNVRTTKRRAAIARAMALMLCAAASVAFACVGVRPQECSTHADCQTDGRGRFCNGRGFCDSECSANADCPCGSFCARSCGICVRDDLAGPATCFAFQHGLSTADMLGACRADTDGGVTTTTTTAADGAAVEGGACVLPLVSLPTCLQSPPQPTTDASELDAGVVDAAVADAGTTAEGGDQ